jgi:hypothetical protein
MFEFFKNRHLKRDSEILEKNILKNLANTFPDLIENHRNWILRHVIRGNDHLQLQHSTRDVEYFEANRKRFNKHYKIKGLEILNKNSNSYVPLTVDIYFDSIQIIYIAFSKSLNDEYDLSNVRVSALTSEPLKVDDSEQKTLLRILKNIHEDIKEKIEVDDTFEIELDEKKYYTIFDMEDGNYLAVDSKGRVYRLIHDHEIPAKMIFENVNELMKEFNDDKINFVKYLDD